MQAPGRSAHARSLDLPPTYARLHICCERLIPQAGALLRDRCPGRALARPRLDVPDILDCARPRLQDVGNPDFDVAYVIAVT